ncbi:MAG: HIT domain-containing protein [Planctomycetota bacterium]
MNSRNSIFAPWRIRYILNKGEEPSGCFMCRYAKDPQNDPKNLVVARMKHFFLLLNRYPYSAGHMMLCPYRHHGELSDLSSKTLQELGEGLKQTQLLLQKQMKPQGFNIGLNMGAAAGAGFADHLHFHIIPRWNGDTNFMPILADIQVIPQALEELHTLLTSLWNQEHAK